MANGFYDIQEPGIIADSVFPNRYYIYWRCGLHHTAQTEIQWLITKTVNGVSSTQEIKTESVSGIKDDYQKAYVDITSDQLTNATNLHVSIYATSEVYYTKQDGTPVYYWGGTKPSKDYTFGSTKPSEAPNVPDFTITNATKANVSLTGISTGTFATGVRFEIYKKEYGQSSASFYKSAQVEISNGYAYADIDVDLGAEYTARAAFYNSYNDFDANGELTGIQSPQWSDTENGWAGPIKSAPLPVENFAITTNVVSAGAAVNLSFSWDKNNYADQYEVQYIETSYDWSFEDKIQTFSTEFLTYSMQLQNGGEYRFRIRGTNNAGASEWTEHANISFGLPPLAPTTWSDVSSKINDGTLRFYWKHNARDSTREIKAEISISIDGKEPFIIGPQNAASLDRTNQDEKDWYKNAVYTYVTSNFTKTVKLLWKVRTCGTSGLWGDWSIGKEVTLYAQPGIFSWVQDADGNVVDPSLSTDTIVRYPFKLCTYLYEGENPIIIRKDTFVPGEYNSSQNRMDYGDVYANWLTVRREYEDLIAITIDASGSDWLSFKLYYCDDDGNIIGNSGVHSGKYYWGNLHMSKYIYVEAIVTSGTHTEEEIADAITFTIERDFDEMTQELTEMRLTINAKQDHQILQNDGSYRKVVAGEEIYSTTGTNLYDTTAQFTTNEFTVADVNLEKGNIYTATYSAYFISGAVVTKTVEFTFDPTIGDTNHHPITAYGYYDPMYKLFKIDWTYDSHNVSFPVLSNCYRRNNDGTTTPIMYNAPSEIGLLFDGRPSLKESYYIISVVDKTTNHKDFYYLTDVHRELFPIIQWGDSLNVNVMPIIVPGEETRFEATVSKDESIELIYNISVNETRKSNSEVAVYAGRMNPISYYGEHRDETYTWNVEIPSTDTETLEKFRSLAVYNGKCYIRDCAGDGYWANIEVSISKTYDGLTNKITMNITKIWSLEYD